MHVSLIEFTSTICYCCLSKNKFFKVKINKILFKIDLVTKRFSQFVILSTNKKMFAKPKYNKLISSYVSQKTRRMDFK